MAKDCPRTPSWHTGMTSLTFLWALGWLGVPVQGASRNIRIGLLSELGCCNWMSVYNEGSAINIAFEDLLADGVLNDVSLSIIWRHTTTPSEGLGNAVDLVNNEDIDAIFGSPSSRINVAVAMLTAFWNLPQLSWESRSNELSDKAQFPTFIRTSGPFSSIGLAFADLFKDIGWTKVGFIYEDHGRCQYALDAIRSTFQAANITIMQSINYPRGGDPMITTQRAIEHLTLLKMTSRVIILCDYELIRLIMINALALGMCNGEYLFIMPSDNSYDGQKLWENGDADDYKAKLAFRYVLYVTTGNWYNDTGKQNLVRFGREVIRRMAEPPWNDSYGLLNNISASVDAQYLYDATYLYGLWLNYSTSHGLDIRDGHAMLQFTDGLLFNGVSGPCLMNAKGDRLPLYWIWDFTAEDGAPTIAAISHYGKDAYVLDSEGWSGFKWLTIDGKPPLDNPICGFFNELCPMVPKDTTTVILTSCLSVIAMLAIAIVVGYIIRKRQIENGMLRLIWKIKISDIEMRKDKLGVGSRTKLNQSSFSLMSGYSNSGSENVGPTSVPLTTAVYKGQPVSIRNVVLMATSFTRQDLIELKEMREMQHDNINPFIGACVDVATPCVLFLYCPKGSLQDILENDDIHLDLTFKYSLMLDLVQGMRYIHDSKLGCHGRLKSTNCVVDNRWVLRVTDYGLNRFLPRDQDRPTEEHQRYKSMLWTAPEILAQPSVPLKGTKENDVYAFGIILHELFYRMGTFAGKAHLTFKEIVEKVHNREPSPCRPQIFDNATDVETHIIKLMRLCWEDNEKERPTFKIIRTYTKKNCPDVNRNIVDIILRRLEVYASNLEELVEQRTQLLMEEKQKTDKLLYRMMPAVCADRLKRGDTIYPELYESATVFFSDIVGFTKLACKSSPMEVVDLLNDLYIQFDEIIDCFDAYKVETIGDAYLVVSGIPKRNGNLHAGVIADMSLQIASTLMKFRVRHLPSHQVMVRIGMHTGSCCAGVVGLSMPRYCLFGDTVNTASRMESNGKQQRIHISESSCEALQKLGGYYMTLRGEMEIKGKGLMRTYWLDGKEGYNQPLPGLID